MKFFIFKLHVFFFFLLGLGLNGFSQNVYRVYFTDKKGSDYNPFEYLHPKAIERRILHGLDIYNSSDYPVSKLYLEEIIKLADSIKGSSRWMNAAFLYASDENIEKIKKLPFIKTIEIVLPLKQNVLTNFKAANDFDTIPAETQKQLLAAQLERMNGAILKENNLDGKGVRIAILDVGFKTYSSSPAFEKIRERGGIVATYDFVKKRTEVNIGMMHGTNVFSCIAGQVGPNQMGLATGAEFLLARTESFTEFFNEEEYWLMAAEWADKNGVDIINSSLGYTIQRYLPEDMDGKTTFVSRAAQLAVDKGILVVSSAGNEGTGKWKRVAAPGDAAGVLTVGGIDPTTGIHSDFSSYGPSWDKRLKPEVCAYGTALLAGRNGFSVSDGTSFSSPLVAGFAACLKQRYPYLKNTELKELICRSGDLWPYYDYAHGYGVPQPYFLFKDTLENKPTLSIIEDKDDITFYPIEWDTALLKKPYLDKAVLVTDTEEFDSTIVPYVDSTFRFDSTLTDTATFNTQIIPWDNITRLSSYKTTMPDYLFYHIKNSKGYLDKYYVLDLTDEENGSVSISKNISEKPFYIEFFYKGYYKEILIKE